MVSCIPYVVALILAVNSASGLQCYSCNSNNFFCRYGFFSFLHPVEDCNSGSLLDSLVGAKCVKITARNRRDERYIERGCLNTPALACQVIAKTMGLISDVSDSDPKAVVDVNCYTCESNKCNSASTIARFTLLALLLATFALLF